MEEGQPLFKPAERFKIQLKKEYHRNADIFFEELAEKAQTDKNANSLHVKAYDKAKAELEEARKKLGKAKAGKGWTIAGIIISFVVAVVLVIVGILNLQNGMWWMFLLAAAMVGLGIFFIHLLRHGVKRALLAAQEEVAKKEAAAKSALDTCYADMATLNSLLDDTMPGQVMEKTTPLIDLDPVFSPERYAYMRDRFGMTEDKEDPGTSTLGVISGHIQGNPFILQHVFRSEIQDKTYTGSLTITWTTTHTDSKGNVRTETHSETLYAEVVHPAPAYWDETRLIFGSEVAPHLHFHRNPSGISGKDEKDTRKFIDKKIKEIDKYEEKIVKKGGTFTKLGNDEFEALFGAFDRDNEVEFRLMFTALAQRNLTELIKDPEPYGDDFIMVKDGKLTSIASVHSQHFDYNVSADHFRHYDFKAAKERFVNYCDSFIQGLYFDLAPIMSIPLYQLHKPTDYIYNGDYVSNMTSFEQEAMINKMDEKLFLPDGADPSLYPLMKVASAKKVGEADEVLVSSRSYHTTPMVDYVSKMGGDGRMHQVPVHWTQYDEVNCTRNVGLVDSKKTRPQFNHASLEPLQKYLEKNFHFERGLLSFYLGNKGHLQQSDADAFHDFFKD